MDRTIEVGKGVTVPGSALRMTAVRASGPGGQNVNKVSSKVDLRVDLAQIVGLNDPARARLISLAKNHLDAEGLLQITSQKTRDQAKNLEDACDKVRDLIERAMVAPKPRRPTRPGRGAIERRLTEKKQTSQRKEGRGRSTRRGDE